LRGAQTAAEQHRTARHVADDSASDNYRSADPAAMALPAFGFAGKDLDLVPRMKFNWQELRNRKRVLRMPNRAVARFAGVSESTAQRILNGRHGRFGSYVKIAEAMGVSLVIRLLPKA
jgi:hypothetical protein